MNDLSKDEMVAVLQKVPDGVLGLTDGMQPYCLPFGFVYVQESVYLSLFPKGKKWEYFNKNPRVCFTVFCWTDDRTEWSSVVVDGIMEQVNDMDSITAVVRANIEKMGLNAEEYLEKRMEYYRKNIDNPNALKIFIIKADSMTGKRMKTLLGS